MDSFEIRREWLRQGGNSEAAARAISAAGHPITRQGVHKHVQRANRLQPLTYQRGEPEDQRAMVAYVRACLTAAGIRVSTEPEPQQSASGRESA